MLIELWAFLFGIASWGILLRAIIKRKKMVEAKINRMYTYSWALCSLSLYMPILRFFVSFMEKDFHLGYDYADVYFDAASVLLTINFILTGISVLLSRELCKSRYLNVLLVAGLTVVAVALIIHEIVLWTTV